MLYSPWVSLRFYWKHRVLAGNSSSSSSSSRCFWRLSGFVLNWPFWHAKDQLNYWTGFLLYFWGFSFLWFYICLKMFNVFKWFWRLSACVFNLPVWYKKGQLNYRKGFVFVMFLGFSLLWFYKCLKMFNVFTCFWRLSGFVFNWPFWHEKGQLNYRKGFLCFWGFSFLWFDRCLKMFNVFRCFWRLSGFVFNCRKGGRRAARSVYKNVGSY